MSGKNLVQDLGSQYVREFLCGASFLHDNTVHYLRSVDGAVAITDSFALDAPDPVFNRVHIPISVLQGFETFKYPDLGYRQYTAGNNENVVVSLSTSRSAHRGLRLDLVRQQYLPVFNYLGTTTADSYHVLRNEQRLQLIFNPTYVPFSTAISQLLSGQIAGAAISAHVAIGISCTRSSDRAFDVYFRDRVVGRIDEKGAVHISNKVMNRHDLRKVLT